MNIIRLENDEKNLLIWGLPGNHIHSISKVILGHNPSTDTYCIIKCPHGAMVEDLSKLSYITLNEPIKYDKMIKLEKQLQGKNVIIQREAFRMEKCKDVLEGL